MRPLRHLSTRPELLLDDRAFRIVDPTTRTRVGIPAPFGNERLVAALPTNKTGPVKLAAPRVVADSHGVRLADPQGNLIGRDGLVCHRYLSASKTADTRRL